MTLNASFAGVVAVVLLAFSLPVLAQQMPALTALSPVVATSNPELTTRRSMLMQQREALHGKVDSFNSSCASVTKGSASEASCLKTQAKLHSLLESHIRQSDEFNASVEAAIQNPIRPGYGNDAPPPGRTSFCTAKLRVAADKRAIQQLNLGIDPSNFEAFTAASEAQKAEFENQLRGALVDQAFEATAMAASSVAALNPWTVNKNINELRAIGLGDDRLFAGLRKIAETRDKPEMALAYKDLLDFVRAWKEGVDTGKDMANDVREREGKSPELRLLLGVLRTAQGNPDLGVLVTAADLGLSLAYLRYVSPEVENLSKMTDDTLALLKSRIKRLKADVDALNAEKRAVKGEGSGEPDCS